MMVMVVMVMVMMMVVMVVVIVMVMMVMMVMILRHYNGLFFDSGVALVLSAENLLGIRNGVQQLGK